jgi:hypothetical protein
MTSSVQLHYRAFIPTTSCSAPVLRFGTPVLAVCAAWTSPLASERQVLTFRTRAWLSFARPTCRMPLGQASGFSRTDPGGRGTPRFRHRLIRFRHFIGGLLALASLNLACRDQVPTFPQRSLPSLLTTAACGGLRPAPDCRPRRALLHLSYSSAPSYSDSAFVTHAPQPTSRWSDRRDRELHPDSYRRSCSRRLRVVISTKGFDSPFVRTTTPALEDGASTTAARKPGFSPL